MNGNSTFVTEQLDKGLADFGLIFMKANADKYEILPIYAKDTWGVLMKKNSPLAKKDFVTRADLIDKPLIISRESDKGGTMQEWFGCDIRSLNIKSTYNLALNASILVDEGIGYATCFDKLFNVSGKSRLCFRPLSPTLDIPMFIIWKKYQPFTKAARKFLEKLEELNE